MAKIDSTHLLLDFLSSAITAIFGCLYLFIGFCDCDGLYWQMLIFFQMNGFTHANWSIFLKN